MQSAVFSTSKKDASPNQSLVPCLVQFAHFSFLQSSFDIFFSELTRTSKTHFHISSSGYSSTHRGILAPKDVGNDLNNINILQYCYWEFSLSFTLVYNKQFLTSLIQRVIYECSYCATGETNDKEAKTTFLMTMRTQKWAQPFILIVSASPCLFIAHW